MPSKVVLWKINLSSSNLTGANLKNAVMKGANLCDTKLTGANLTNLEAWGGSFKNADFSDANLTNAHIGNGCFLDAKFIRTQCKRANFVGSNFFETTHPSVTGDLFAHEADFSGAQLAYSDFYDSDILPDQLNKANLRWRTRLPSGSLYSGYHPLFLVTKECLGIEGAIWENDRNINGAICGCKKVIEANAQTIIEEKEKIVDRRGLPVPFDPDKEILREIWSNYGRHRMDIFAKNWLTKLLYIFLEYQPSGYVIDDNALQRKIRHVEDGLRFWEAYKETSGFTVFKNFTLK